jgi:hypothetical protein
MSSKDHWRITTRAIELEMERIAGLLQKSVHFQSRTTASHPLLQRQETESAPKLAPQLSPQLSPDLVHQR